MNDHVFDLYIDYPPCCSPGATIAAGLLSEFKMLINHDKITRMLGVLIVDDSIPEKTD